MKQPYFFKMIQNLFKTAIHWVSSYSIGATYKTKETGKKNTPVRVKQGKNIPTHGKRMKSKKREVDVDQQIPISLKPWLHSYKVFYFFYDISINMLRSYSRVLIYFTC